MTRVLQEWERDLIRNVGTDLVRSIAEDFRRGLPSSGGSMSKVVPVGAGVVVGGSDTVASSGTGGWTTPPQVDSWRPPGLEICDALLDQQDALDRAARIRELAEAAVTQRALAEAETKARDEELKKHKGEK